MTDHPQQNISPAPERSKPTLPLARPATPGEAIAVAKDLLIHYCLDLDERRDAQEWIEAWLQDYPAYWLSFAIIEALYLGRYKAISVEQILVNWKRRGKPRYHFTHDFERLICRRSPPNQAPSQRQLQMPSLSYPGNQAPMCSVVVAHTPEPSSRRAGEFPAQSSLSTLASENQSLSSRPSPPVEVLPSSQPIHKFVPASLAPNFHHRLKAVAASNENC